MRKRPPRRRPSRRRRTLAAAAVTAALLAAFLTAEVPERRPGELPGEPWPMHTVDDRFRGAGGLSGGDVNGDGAADLLTAYRLDQRLVIALHPGNGVVDGVGLSAAALAGARDGVEQARARAAADPRLPWPTVPAWPPGRLEGGAGVDPESAALADLDGDGALDVAVAQGFSPWWSRRWHGSEAGVRIVWGPPAAAFGTGRPQRAPETGLEEAEGAAAGWSDGGRIPATVDRGHFRWVLPADLDGDGRMDLLAGGRAHGGNGARAGVVWLAAPADPRARRDLDRWSLRAIDPGQSGGHGAAVADLDGDGDLDAVLANADPDTPARDERLVWYESPGPAATTAGDAWRRHVIHAGPELDPETEITLADLDGDARTDVLTQTDEAIWWFRRSAGAPVAGSTPALAPTLAESTPATFELTVIPKPPAARGRARALRVADLDGDGRLDVLAMRTHRAGVLPADRAAAFWMRRSEDPGAPGGWETRVIKWGSGRTMLLPFLGESWEQAHVADVDGDGDLDIAAALDGWWEAGSWEARTHQDLPARASSVSLVWFENRLEEPPPTAREEDGLCGIEAEAPARWRDGTWVERARYPEASGGAYVQAYNAVPPWLELGLGHVRRALTRRHLSAHSLAPRDSQGITHRFAVAGGRYRIRFRRWVPGRWGYGLGANRSDALWLAVDDAPFALADDAGPPFDTWTWTEGPPVELTPGVHELHLRVAERGYALDRVLLYAEGTAGGR